MVQIVGMVGNGLTVTKLQLGWVAIIFYIGQDDFVVGHRFGFDLQHKGVGL